MKVELLKIKRRNKSTHSPQQVKYVISCILTTMVTPTHKLIAVPLLFKAPLLFKVTSPSVLTTAVITTGKAGSPVTGQGGGSTSGYSFVPCIQHTYLVQTH